MAQFAWSRALVRSWFVAVAAVALLVGALAAPSAAVPGALDPSFDTDGKVSTDFAGRFDEGWGLAIQPDGRIVIAGETVRAVGGVDERDFAAVRYLSDGALDPSFGTGGKVSTDFGRNFELALDMARQPDGKIVAAGISGTIDVPASFDFALARYNTDGSLDPSFGTGGKVLTDLGRDDEINSVTVQPDGKIVVAGFSGTARNGDRGDFAIARYTARGALDPSFGTGGRVTTDFAGGSDSGEAVALQPDGKIIVSGSATRAGSGGDFAIARYTARGALDPSFGTGGRVTTDLSGRHDVADAVAIQPDGRIVAAGGSDVVTNSSGAYALARYSAKGALDASFGAGGTVETDLTDGHDEVFGLALQSDGKIVAAGGANFVLAQAGDFALVRYAPDGSLDAGFGSGGTVTTDFAGGFDNAFDVAIQADGKIVAVGEVTFSDATTSRDIGLVRYLAS
jgi:uncharacterized delta-60 repeat protein